MRYFKLGQDQRIPYAVLLTGINTIGGYFESKGGDLSKLDDVIVSFVHSSPVNFYPDILDRQLFMIKGAVKEVFDLFSPELEYKRCFMIDPYYNTCERYYIPILGVVDCLSVRYDNRKDRHIFRIANAKETTVVAALDVIEALLRRNAEGIRIGLVNLE